ncbi:hypothetical protein ACFU3J_25980 [Streptomyces sp. NPDC057411]|uniref:hypothetical protein n=1 Tax=unclassified Streptomyces TaxID=2593676 RepID=UPI0036308CA1
MTRTRNTGTKSTARPTLELHVGGMHLIVQRIPGWLVTLASLAGGAAGTWWAQR